MMRAGIFLLLFVCQVASGWSWRDVFQRADEQGYDELLKGHPLPAASLFTDSKWQGVAFYRGGQYDQAVAAFAKGDDAVSHYNRGNALAQQGNFGDAIAAYDLALQRDPEMSDAKHNRELLEKLRQSPPEDSPSPQDKQTKSEEKPQEPQNTQTHAEAAPSQNQPESPSDQKADNKSTSPQPMASGENPADTGNSESWQDAKAQEQDQMNQQWFRRVPDDPGGLLRQKFIRDHQHYMQNK